MSNQYDAKVLKELQDVKKLLVLQLLDAGFQAGILADFLEVDSGDFSRMFPAKKLLKGRRSAGEQ